MTVFLSQFFQRVFIAAAPGQLGYSHPYRQWRHRLRRLLLDIRLTNLTSKTSTQGAQYLFFVRQTIFEGAYLAGGLDRG